MLYLFGLQRNGTRSIYRLFDTHTESVIDANNELIIKLINEYATEMKNLYVDNQEIRIKKWPNASIDYGSREWVNVALNNILIGKVGKQKFKLLNHNGEIKYTEEDFLKRLIRRGKVANCEYTINGKIEEYKSIDTCNTTTDPYFINYIDQEFKKFRVKANVLGIGSAFGYTIEGQEVKIINYTEGRTKIIVPNFITTICADAFENKGKDVH